LKLVAFNKGGKPTVMESAGRISDSKFKIQNIKL
jgi:hypothetical protein